MTAPKPASCVELIVTVVSDVICVKLKFFVPPFTTSGTVPTKSLLIYCIVPTGSSFDAARTIAPFASIASVLPCPESPTINDLTLILLRAFKSLFTSIVFPFLLKPVPAVIYPALLNCDQTFSPFGPSSVIIIGSFVVTTHPVSALAVPSLTNTNTPLDISLDSSISAALCQTLFLAI